MRPKRSRSREQERKGCCHDAKGGSGSVDDSRAVFAVECRESAASRVGIDACRRFAGTGDYVYDAIEGGGWVGDSRAVFAVEGRGIAASPVGTYTCRRLLGTGNYLCDARVGSG